MQTFSSDFPLQYNLLILSSHPAVPNHHSSRNSSASCARCFNLSVITCHNTKFCKNWLLTYSNGGQRRGKDRHETVDELRCGGGRWWYFFLLSRRNFSIVNGGLRFLWHFNPFETEFMLAIVCLQKQAPELWPGRTGSWLQMNQLSLRNNRLKFKTAGKLPIILEEFIEYTPI